MKKIIGCPAWKIENDYFGIPLSYLIFLSKFGIPRMILPSDVDNPPKVDLLVLPGGLDINPLTYGEVPHYMTQNPNVILEYFDKEILPTYLDNDTPILGICRGAQRLYTLFGGELDQHNTWHERSSHKKDQCHGLVLNHNILEHKNLIEKVTSRHHQVCKYDEFNENIEVMAWPEFKSGTKSYRISEIVEIFKIKNRKILGVQYHPEDHDGTDKLTSYLIDKFLLEI